MQHVSTVFVEERVRWWALAVTGGLLALHVFAARATELDFDEAYYVLWARRLSWGYVDHPPMIAVWIRLSTTLFGETPFGARMLSVIATALGTAGIVAIARTLYPTRPALGWVAALVFQTMPLLAVAGFVTTPDVPLVTFWTIAVLCLAHVWRSGAAWGWVGVGIAAGLALQSKYSGLFLGAGIVGAMVIVPSLRRWFAHPMPYVGGAIAIALFAPVVMWNAQHEWVSFLKQFGRAAGSTYSGAYIGEYAGVLAGLANPAVFVMALAAAALAWRERRASTLALDTDGEARRLLLALTVPMLLYFLKHALHDRVQGNWVAPVFPLLAVLAADWATQPATPRWDALSRWRAVVWSSVICGGLALVAVAHAVTGVLPIPVRRDISLQRLQGWSGLARDVAALAPRGATVLTSGYALTSHLSVYSRISGKPIVEVAQINERARWFFQAQTLMPSDTILYVSDVERAQPDLLRARFASVSEIARIDRRFAGRTLRTYVVYRLEKPTAPLLMEPSFKLPL
jgi:4-amino-4-deoxy-L-arabinose transferase-like glycosyltransferase